MYNYFDFYTKLQLILAAFRRKMSRRLRQFKKGSAVILHFFLIHETNSLNISTASHRHKKSEKIYPKIRSSSITPSLES